MKNYIKLSVIIPTRNRAKLLGRTLDSILNQTLDKNQFEVLVINNGSGDSTEDVVKSFKNKILNLRYFFDQRAGLHIGRHVGFKEALSDILTYADDDIEAFPEWLEAILDSFNSNNDVVLVGGKVLPKWEHTPPDWILDLWENKKNQKILGYLSLIDMGEKPFYTDPFNIFGCNFSVKKFIIEKAGGFHPDGMPQDKIIYRGDGESYISGYIKNNNYKAYYNPKASVYHIIPEERINLEYFCQRAFNQGISYSYFIIREKFYNNKYKIDIINILKKMIKNLLKNINIFLFYNKNLKKINKSFIKGYKYHQKMVKTNKNLFEWVIKDNYFD